MNKRVWHRMAAVALLCALAALTVPAAFGDTLQMQRAEMKAVLDQVANKVSQEYYDPTLHGLNWKAAIADARHKIDAADEPGAMLTAIWDVLQQLQDSHTLFIPPYRTQYAVFGFEMKMYGDEARISKIKPNSAADRAGLQPGDRVLNVNGIAPSRKNLDVLMLYFRVLRPVATFQLITQRDAEPQRTVRLDGEVRVRPQMISLTSMEVVKEEMMEERAEEDRARKNPFEYSMKDDIGYVRLPQFSGDAAFLHELLKKVDHAKAVIVDLRGNGGGSIDSLADLTGFFEPQPTELGNFVGRKKTEPIKVKPQQPNFNVPMFILVDSESASSAEIFARHFQRERHATVIGDRSSGSVMVARFFPGQIGGDIVISFGTEIAVGKMVMPGGEELENVGVKPDSPCVPSAAAMRKGADPCLSMAYDLAHKATSPAQATAAAK